MAADSRSHVPHTWSDVFTALPDEVPPAGGWSRLQAAIDSQASQHPAHTSLYAVRRRRTVLGMLAASLALAALIPALVRKPGRAPMASPPVAAHQRPAEEPAGGLDREESMHARRVAAPAGGDEARSIARHRDGGAGAERASRRDPISHRSVRTVAAAGSPRPAQAAVDTSVRGDADRSVQTRPLAFSSVQAAEAGLAALYLESARLEALLALTRDDRVQSATAAVLAEELDSRMALIDAALAEPYLPEPKRHSLWRQRVATLREITGTESTERWLAANGTAGRDSLVRID